MRVRRIVSVVATGIVVAGVGLSLAGGSQAAVDPASTGVLRSVTPCRVVDTRIAGGAITGGSTRNFAVSGTAGFASQGGKVGGCAVPANATSVSVTVTAVAPAAGGFLRAWPAGTSEPTATFLNYQRGVGISNSGLLPVRTGPAPHLSVKAYGTTHLVIDVFGYTLPTTEALAALQGQVTALETLLAGVTRVTVDGQPTLRFSDMNLQIINGNGATSTTDGRGNLIVGYGVSVGDARTGSHNVVIGDSHTYTSTGGLLAGDDNATTAPSASVTGGSHNTANGAYASVTGGFDNVASGDSAVVTGGTSNAASGEAAAVAGGSTNSASGYHSASIGGGANTASADGATVVGGSANTASGGFASVLGGFEDTASGPNQTVVGP